MLMVIFGAGASFDSSLDFPPPPPSTDVFTTSGTPPAPEDPRDAWRPPLTNGLFLNTRSRFGKIVETYPKLQGIVTFLRRPQNGSVEQQLELYLDQASADPERARQLLCVRYYLHDLFRMVSAEWLKLTNGVTNYATLIDQIRHLNTTGEAVCLVSFNYDLLLDNALSAFDYKPQSPENQFKAHPIFKVFKPHGSVDWARLAEPHRSYTGDPNARFTPQLLIEAFFHDFTMSSTFVRANATDPNQMFAHTRPILPAIAIPVQTKTEDFFEWPRSHRIYLEELLPHVTKILIIGWRGKEAHFLKLLRENLSNSGVTQITHLQAVGRDSTEASDIAKQFIADIDRRVNYLDTATRGFSHFVREEQVGFFFKE